MALGYVEYRRTSREDDEMILVHLNDLRDQGNMDTQEPATLFPYCVEF